MTGFVLVHLYNNQTNSFITRFKFAFHRGIFNASSMLVLIKAETFRDQLHKAQDTLT